ncbi:hypothetical protein Z043_113477 [Scleropages formosus]|uniref:C1q domain-containing protein n=1 Tax=Scleropages formosus TaxID=113540 RepID=A0A0P7YK06_SCLFO|nr:hypothetical protein Z043_113477 [Scleropages formosus]
MAQQGDRIEAVLTVSHRSKCGCGGSASVALVLGLRRGDTVRLISTAGRLAVPEPDEVLSTFGAIFLYPTPTSR